MTSEEKTPYHTIMVDAWRIFIKDRSHERYCDKWWEEIIGEYKSLRDSYIGTKLDDYVCQLSQVFLDEYERGQKRERPNRIPQELLPEPQENYQAELQLSDSVSEMGGCEEIVEPFT